MARRKESKMSLIKGVLCSVFLITSWCISPTSLSAQDKASKDPETPRYEVYVLMSASWAARFPRFSSLDNDDIKEKFKEETPITFAYIKGPGVEMVLGPGSRKGTIFQIVPKGSLDFIDQKTLLASLGAVADKIKTAVIEVSCFDHLGGIDAFPNATFVIQKKEFDSLPTKYSTAEDIEKIMQLKKEGRLKIIEGDQELAPGIKAHFLGGHTPGTQFLSVHTDDGLVVLGGDGLYTYENLKYDIPGSYNYGNEAQKESYKRIRKVLGDSDELLVPGHDMEVFRRFHGITERVIQVKLR
jgi:hypothetical protein